MEDSTTNNESLSNDVSTPNISGGVDVAVIGNDEIPTNTDDENTLIDQINTSDNTLTPTQVLVQKMINREPLTEYNKSDTPNVEQTNMEFVTDSPVCSGAVSEPVLNKVIDFDKKRYWDMIKNQQELPFDELLSKYDFRWCEKPFLNDESETLAHAYVKYGVIPENAIGANQYIYNVWQSIFWMRSPLTGKTVVEIAFANKNIPDIPFHEYFTGEYEEDKCLIEIVCPEAINFSLTDMIMAFKQYKDNLNVPEVPDMDLDNSYTKTTI